MAHKLLAINFGGIGDEILFLPVLASIKEAYPETDITLLLEPRSKAIKDITNLIDEIKLFDIKKRPLLPTDYLELLQILRTGKYETVISSGSSPLVACMLFASGIKERVGYDSGALSHVLLTHAVKLNKNQYAGNMYHDLVQGMGLAQRQVMPKIQVSQDNLAYMQDFLLHLPQTTNKEKTKRIVIHPGTSLLAIQKGIIKTWPAQHWAALINELLLRQDIQIILAGGPDDEKTVAAIKQEFDSNPSFVSRCLPNQNLFISAYGATKSLADLAALIMLSDLLICVDSAPMHIAVALNKPLLALFGPTDPAHLLPVLPHYKYLRYEVDGAPMTKILPNTVYQSALDLLQPVKAQ